MGTERVDIAIVGAGLAGLSTAVACHKVRPDAIIKVYERRKAPAGYARPPGDTPQNTTAAASVEDDEAVAVGGGVRLEMNGLKACAAISRDLAGRVVSEGLYASKVLLHDTQGALRPCCISRCTRPAFNAACRQRNRMRTSWRSPCSQAVLEAAGHLLCCCACVPQVVL